MCTFCYCLIFMRGRAACRVICTSHSLLCPLPSLLCFLPLPLSLSLLLFLSLFLSHFLSLSLRLLVLLSLLLCLWLPSSLSLSLHSCFVLFLPWWRHLYSSRNVKENEDLIESHPNAVLVHSPTGGHVGFHYTSDGETRSWADDLAVRFLHRLASEAA